MAKKKKNQDALSRPVKGFTGRYFTNILDFQPATIPEYLNYGGRKEGGRLIVEILLEERKKRFYRTLNEVDSISFIIRKSRSSNGYDHQVLINQRRDWPECDKVSENFLTKGVFLDDHNLAFTITIPQLESVTSNIGNNQQTAKLEIEICIKGSEIGIFKYSQLQNQELLDWKNNVRPVKPITRSNSLF